MTLEWRKNEERPQNEIIMTISSEWYLNDGMILEWVNVTRMSHWHWMTSEWWNDIRMSKDLKMSLWWQYHIGMMEWY